MKSPLEHLAVLEEDLVGGEQHVKPELLALVAVKFVGSDNLTRLLGANVQHHIQIGRPPRKLSLPCCYPPSKIVRKNNKKIGAQRKNCTSDGRKGNNDKEGSVDNLGVEEVRKEGNGLAGLAKPHFVSKDRVVPLCPSKREPIEPFQLIVTKLGGMTTI